MVKNYSTKDMLNRNFLSLLQSVTAYYNSRTTKYANGEIIFGASGQLTRGIASYNGSPPVVSDFSSRGPVIDFGVPSNYTNLLPLSDVLKPNILAPGEKIWASWSSVPGTEEVNFIGKLLLSLFYDHV
jgi:hypothetical protein